MTHFDFSDSLSASIRVFNDSPPSISAVLI